ncbi:MAG: site-2 protease family protein, partial [Pseudomonadota bacterium]|nr:site-2 protease family protein [Pseudomonadota bacterium]
MNLLQPILPFLLALGALVTFHELGHYWVARWCGVKVLRFSVGMGKVIYSRRIGPDQTEWALSILPLGGYVKMLDIRENPDVTLSPAELRREFTHQSVWKRMAIVAAGPIANFLLAIAIFSGLYVV